MDDSTTILFGLPGVAVTHVERAADEVRVVHVRTADGSAAACPQCGVFSTSLRQRRTTRPKDLPYGEEPLTVRWHKVQWRCREPACPRVAFLRVDPGAATPGPGDGSTAPACREGRGRGPGGQRGQRRSADQLADGARGVRRPRRRRARRARPAAGAGHR
jgi:transposase